MPGTLKALAAGIFAVTMAACSGEEPSVDTPAAPASSEPVETATTVPTVSPWEVPPQPAEDAAILAEQLATAERRVREAQVSGGELAWMGAMQQAIYRKLVESPELRAPVLSALPDAVLPIAEANLKAGIELRAMIRPGTGLPPWRIVEPAAMDELLSHYKAAEAEFGVPWPYLAAIHLTETVMGRIRGISVAGAQGPMQFMPATWAQFGEGDINENRDAIRAAARYLRASGAPANMDRALYSYNPSDRYVEAVSAYAQVMRNDPAAFRGYYHWQVYFLTTEGDKLLPVGWSGE